MLQWKQLKFRKVIKIQQLMAKYWCKVIKMVLKLHSQVWHNFYQLWKPFKNDENGLSHLKSSFLSQDISVFVLTFWSCIKTVWLNFMTSQPGYQTIVIHILPNISRSKGNQTMKFGQLIECKMRNILFEKSYTKCSEETSPRPFSEKLQLHMSLDQ